MTKQEAIEKAYGEYYFEFKDNIDENGWTNSVSQGMLNYITCDSKDMHIISGSPENWYRPMSLRGIENNNGWIRIESESDLPKQNGRYWIMSKSSIINQDVFDSTDMILKSLWKSNYTHYQPIIKPEPPIY